MHAFNTQKLHLSRHQIASFFIDINHWVGSSEKDQLSTAQAGLKQWWKLETSNLDLIRTNFTH